MGMVTMTMAPIPMVSYRYGSSKVTIGKQAKIAVKLLMNVAIFACFPREHLDIF
jgi:hypothetical protein